MEDMHLAKPNYAFQKRQRELAKKQKKEEKRLRRAESPEQPADEPSIDDPAAIPVNGDDPGIAREE